MGLGFFGWLITIVGSFLGGVILSALIYLLYDEIVFRMQKKKMPKDAKTLSNPGKLELNIEEVKQNDRHSKSKFREFEKLKRLGEREPSVKKSDGSPTGDIKSSERSLLPTNAVDKSNRIEDRI